MKACFLWPVLLIPTICCSLSSCTSDSDGLTIKTITRHNYKEISRLLHLEYVSWNKPSISHEIDRKYYRVFFKTLDVPYTICEQPSLLNAELPRYDLLFKEDKYNFIIGFSNDGRAVIDDKSKLIEQTFISLLPVSMNKLPM